MPLSSRHALLPHALSLLLSAFGVTGALAQGVTPAVVLNILVTTTLPDNTVSVALNARGEGIAAWADPVNGAVRYALKHGTAWTPAKVAYNGRGETAGEVQAVMRDDGTAVILFAGTRPGPIQYCAWRLRVVRCQAPSTAYARVVSLTPGAAAWSLTTLSAPGQWVGEARLGRDAADNLTATWVLRTAMTVPGAIQSARLPAGGRWSVQPLYGLGGAALSSTLGVSANGGALLAWQEATGLPDTPWAIRTLTQDANGIWTSAPDTAALMTGQAGSLRAAVDGAGRAALVWDSRWDIHLATRQPGAGWTGKVLAAAPADFSTTNFAPDIAADRQGDLLVAWGENSQGTPQVHAELQAADGSVSVATWPGNPAPRVSLSAERGVGLVAWADDMDYKAHMAGFRFLPVANWVAQPPLVLGDALWGTQVAVAAGADGQAGMVWLGSSLRRFAYRFVGAAWLP